MADSDATACARCGEATREPVWWEPGLDSREYLESQRGFVLESYPHRPEAPLCVGCSRKLDTLTDRYETGASAVPGEEGANENALTEFLGEIDIGAFQDAGPSGMA